MSFDGRNRSSGAGTDDGRIVHLERIAIALLLGALVAFGLWMVVGIGFMLTHIIPLWVPLVAWPFIAFGLWAYDVWSE